MAYLGNAPARSFISFERQVFTIVNSQTAYTLDHSVNNENDLRLVINNIVQEPGSGKAYTASGTTLTLSAALTNGTDEMYCVFLGRATATNAPAAGSVNTAAIAADAITEAKIADDAVESEHLNDNVISGQTELASAPASTDELLISDGGTLKRIDVSLVGGTNTPNFLVEDSASQALANTTITKLSFGTETFDSDGAFASDKFTVPSGKAGKYFFYASWQSANTSDYNEQRIYLYKNGTAIDPNIQGYHDHYGSIQISKLVDLAVSDYIEVYAYQNAGGAGSTLGTSIFSGFKIIE